MTAAIILIALLTIASFAIGFFSGRAVGAIKVYYMDKESARKWIWGKKK